MRNGLKEAEDAGKGWGWLLLVLALVILALVLLPGCAYYDQHIAPHVPTVRIGTSFGAHGLGLNVGWESRWNAERGERERGVYLGLREQGAAPGTGPEKGGLE